MLEEESPSTSKAGNSAGQCGGGTQCNTVTSAEGLPAKVEGSHLGWPNSRQWPAHSACDRCRSLRTRLARRLRHKARHPESSWWYAYSMEPLGAFRMTAVEG